jgi:uncharacterized membrane protein YuzA (DUF378 family)
MASHGTTMHIFLMALVLIGALNWGLGLFNINAVESITPISLNNGTIKTNNK